MSREQDELRITSTLRITKTTTENGTTYIVTGPTLEVLMELIALNRSHQSGQITSLVEWRKNRTAAFYWHANDERKPDAKPDANA